jgi:hypothetical protein
MKLLAQSQHGVPLGGVRAALPAAPGDLADRSGPALYSLLAALGACQSP